MFFNRKKEIEILTNDFNQPYCTYNFIFGRKKIGKTLLINEYVKNKKFLYLFSFEINLNFMLENYKSSIDSFFNLNNDKKITSFNDLFSYLSELYIDSKIVIVIENIENILFFEKDFIKDFYLNWNKYLSKMNIQFILTSSIYPNSLDEKNTYKNASNLLKIKSLDYEIIEKIIPNKSSDEYLKIYSTLGTNVKHLKNYNSNQSFEDNLKEMFFSKESFYIKDMELLIKSLFNEVSTYNSILYAISLGNNKIGQIAKFLGLKSSYLTRYMNKLVDLMIIEKVIPLNDKDENSKFGRYEIEDNFLKFWFSTIFPNMHLIYNQNFIELERKFHNNLIKLLNNSLKRVILKKIDSIVDFVPLKFGSWWNNKDIEIDIIAYDNKNIVFIDCNYNNLIEEKSIENLHRNIKEFKTNLKIEYKVITNLEK